jgi:single-strand DNA-binding protein
MDRNEVVLVGRLTADPVVRTTKTSKQVATLRVATNSWNGKVETAEFHNVIAWERLAARAEHATKGQRVVVLGRIAHREYTDREGVNRRLDEVVASTLEFAVEDRDPGLPPRPVFGQPPTQQPSRWNEDQPVPGVDEDDLDRMPF